MEGIRKGGRGGEEGRGGGRGKGGGEEGGARGETEVAGESVERLLKSKKGAKIERWSHGYRYFKGRRKDGEGGEKMVENDSRGGKHI